MASVANGASVPLTEASVVALDETDIEFLGANLFQIWSLELQECHIFGGTFNLALYYGAQIFMQYL